MSLTFNEIRLAALAGKTFTLTGVRIRELGIYENGIKIKYLMPNASNYQPDASLDFISIDEQPKYDPCRLFKKGDIVRLKEWNGRCPALPEDRKRNNGLFKVHEDEKFNSSVEITRENAKDVYIAPICFLELVTPVEELEPYSIDPANTNVLFKRGKKFATFEDDDEAQELCDRLNAEHRKEQNNG